MTTSTEPRCEWPGEGGCPDAGTVRPDRRGAVLCELHVRAADLWHEALCTHLEETAERNRAAELEQGREAA